jgi:glutathione S-transferase-like protein
MKLYICYGTFRRAPRSHLRHPCGYAYHALKDAGYEPEVERTYGAGIGPGFIQRFLPGKRSEVEKVSGQRTVPVLVTDQGDVITESQRIVDWAKAHPAT